MLTLKRLSVYHSIRENLTVKFQVTRDKQVLQPSRELSQVSHEGSRIRMKTINTNVDTLNSIMNQILNKRQKVKIFLILSVNLKRTRPLHQIGRAEKRTYRLLGKHLQ